MRTRAVLLGAALSGLAMVACLPANAAPYAILQWQINVERSADQVWAKVGPYCALADWLKTPCAYVSGSGEVGSIRKLGAAGTTQEIMISQTPRSYNYMQTAGGMAANSYHGQLAVEPNADGKTSTIHYTLFYDEANIAADMREATRKRFTDAFQKAVETMKSLAEAQ